MSFETSRPDWDWVSLKEFKEKGYLQEVNRRVLHPLGMAISVIWPCDEDGNPLPSEEVEAGDVKFGGIYDFRDDPEGMAFGRCDPAAAERVVAEMEAKRGVREENFGWLIQPVGEEGVVVSDEETEDD